jgi:hypothetical protein
MHGNAAQDTGNRLLFAGSPGQLRSTNSGFEPAPPLAHFADKNGR